MKKYTRAELAARHKQTEAPANVPRPAAVGLPTPGLSGPNGVRLPRPRGTAASPATGLQSPSAHGPSTYYPARCQSRDGARPTARGEASGTAEVRAGADDFDCTTARAFATRFCAAELTGPANNVRQFRRHFQPRGNFRPCQYRQAPAAMTNHSQATSS